MAVVGKPNDVWGRKLPRFEARTDTERTKLNASPYIITRPNIVFTLASHYDFVRFYERFTETEALFWPFILHTFISL